VAIPGDSLLIKDTKLYINNLPQVAQEKQQHLYNITANKVLSDKTFTQLGISEYGAYAPYHYFAHTTESVAEQLRKYKGVDSVEMHNDTESSVFPYHANYSWTQDNFGPLWVPQKGATVKLTIDNLPLYKRIIETYEGHSLQVDEEKIYIDGKESDSYTFAMDYFFMMGDNRHNSLDSRFWGFVPEDHIVGKALFIIFSKGEDGIRWDRMFKKIE
jgi:signal peptidase I